MVFIFAMFGLYSFSAGIQGFMEAPLNLPVRLLTLACAVALLSPFALLIHLGGLVVLGVVFFFSAVTHTMQCSDTHVKFSPQPER